MKRNFKKYPALCIAVLMLFAVLASCDASAPGEAYPGMNFAPNQSMDAFYPEENGEGIISPESQSSVRENPFTKTQQQAISTFSADVDTASYTLFRKHVNNGYGWVEMQSDYVGGNIRTEEMLNYFDYDYAEPAEGDLFGVNAKILPCPWNAQNHLVMLGFKAKDAEKPAGNNLVFLIDISGSMNSTDKLPLLQKTFSYLVSNLTENDRVSIVTYAGGERVVLEGCEGNKYEQIMHAINNLEASGSTNGQAGLKKAYEIAQSCYIEGGNNRIIMASDGDLNVGISNPEELKKFVETKRDGGIYLSVLGFGSGNFRDDNMETLADHGNGVYYYIDGEVEAEKIFGSELCSTLTTVANDVKLQVTFEPVYVEKYRLIGYENRIMTEEDFTDDTKDAGEVGAGHTLTVCYEVTLTETANATGESEKWFDLAVRWKNPGMSESEERAYEMGNANLTETLDDDARFAAAIIETAMLLHKSEYAGDASLDSVLALLGDMSEKDAYQTEFEQLILKLRTSMP